MGKMSVHKWNGEVAGACLLLGNRMEQGTRWSVGRIRANVVGFFGVPADWGRRRSFTPACSIRKGCLVGAACAVSRTCRRKDIPSRRRVHNQHSHSVGVHPRTPRNRAGWRTSWRTALNHVVVSPSPLSAPTAGEFEHLARRDYTCATGPTPPAHDFVPVIGPQAAYSRKVPWWPPVRRRVLRLLRYSRFTAPTPRFATSCPRLACRPHTAKWCRGGLLVVEGCRHFCATPVPQGIWVWALSVESIIVRAVNPDHSEGLQYHVLPDDPLRALNILREAAGLPPLSDEPDR
jgi:hypothetical protein